MKIKNKIVSREELKEICDKLHAQGQIIVTCNGSFDLFHYGHLCFLEEAKKQGDVLIVGLNSDSSIKVYKNPNRPIINQEQRSKLMAAIGIVDYVHIFDETVPMPFLEVVKPHIHVNGAEYGTRCIEADCVESSGGKIHLMGKVAGLSTTQLIEKIKTNG